jgi:hypothetical protein
VQLQELPRLLRGDAAGTIGVPADGEWTHEVAAAYADRILARLRQHITNFEFLWADFLPRRIKRQDVEKDFDGALEEALKLARTDSDYLPGWCGPVTDD